MGHSHKILYIVLGALLATGLFVFSPYLRGILQFPKTPNSLGNTTQQPNSDTFKNVVAAPDTKNFSVTSKIPASTKDTSIIVTGTADVGDYVLINDQQVAVALDGTFSRNIILSGGANIITFKLRDRAGNTTQILNTYTITLENTAPLLTTNFCDQKPNLTSKTTGSACVALGPWQGRMYSASVPVTGYAIGSIKSVTIDGKNISWDQSGKIDTKVQLNLQFGANKYKVVAEDNLGNVATQYVDINIKKD